MQEHNLKHLEVMKLPGACFLKPPQATLARRLKSTIANVIDSDDDNMHVCEKGVCVQFVLGRIE